MNTWAILLLLLLSIAAAKDTGQRKSHKVSQQSKQQTPAAVPRITPLVHKSAKSEPARINQISIDASSPSKAPLHSKLRDRIKREISSPTALEASSLEATRAKRCNDVDSGLQAKKSTILARVAKRKAPIEKLLQKRARKLNSLEEGFEESLVQKMLQKLGDENSIESYSDENIPYQYNLLTSQERPYKRSIPAVTTETPVLHRATRTTHPPSGYQSSSRLHDSLASPHRRFDTLKEYLRFVQEQHQKAHDNFQNRLKAPSQVIRTEIPTPVAPETPQSYYDPPNNDYGYQSGQFPSQGDVLGGSSPTNSLPQVDNSQVWPYPHASNPAPSLSYQKDALYTAHDSLHDQSQQYAPFPTIGNGHNQQQLTTYQYNGDLHTGSANSTNLASNWHDPTYFSQSGSSLPTKQQPVVQHLENNNLPYDLVQSAREIQPSSIHQNQQYPVASGYEATHQSYQRKLQLPERKKSTLQVSRQRNHEGITWPKGEGVSRNVGYSSGRISSQPILPGKYAHSSVSHLSHDVSNPIDGVVSNSAQNTRTDQGNQGLLLSPKFHTLKETGMATPAHTAAIEAQEKNPVKESTQVHHSSVPNLQLALPEPNPYEDGFLPVLQQPIPLTTVAPTVNVQLALQSAHSQNLQHVIQSENAARTEKLTKETENSEHGSTQQLVSSSMHTAHQSTNLQVENHMPENLGHNLHKASISHLQNSQHGGSLNYRTHTLAENHTPVTSAPSTKEMFSSMSYGQNLNHPSMGLGNHLPESTTLQAQSHNEENYNLNPAVQNLTPENLVHHLSQEPPILPISQVNHDRVNNLQAPSDNEKEHQVLGIQSFASPLQPVNQDQNQVTGSQLKTSLSQNFSTLNEHIQRINGQHATTIENQPVGNLQQHITPEQHIQGIQLLNKPENLQQEQALQTNPSYANPESSSLQQTTVEHANTDVYQAKNHQGTLSSLLHQNDQKTQQSETSSSLTHNDNLQSHHHWPAHSEEPFIVNPKFMHGALENLNIHQQNSQIVATSHHGNSENYNFNQHLTKATQGNQQITSSFGNHEATNSADHTSHFHSKNSQTHHHLPQPNAEQLIVNPKFMSNNHNERTEHLASMLSTSQIKELGGEQPARQFIFGENQNVPSSRLKSQQMSHDESSSHIQAINQHQPPSDLNTETRGRVENTDESAKLFNKVVSELKANQNGGTNANIPTKGVELGVVTKTSIFQTDSHNFNEPNLKAFGETVPVFHQEKAAQRGNFRTDMSQVYEPKNLPGYQGKTLTHDAVPTAHGTPNTGNLNQHQSLSQSNPLPSGHVMSAFQTGPSGIERPEIPPRHEGLKSSTELNIQQNPTQPAFQQDFHPVLRPGEITNLPEKQTHHTEYTRQSSHLISPTDEISRMQDRQAPFFKKPVTSNSNTPEFPNQAGQVPLNQQRINSNQEHELRLPSLPQSVLETQPKEGGNNQSPKIFHVGFGGGHNTGILEHATTSPNLQLGQYHGEISNLAHGSQDAHNIMTTVPPQINHSPTKGEQHGFANYNLNLPQRPDVRRLDESSGNHGFIPPAVQSWPSKEPVGMHPLQSAPHFATQETHNFDVHGKAHHGQIGEAKPLINGRLPPMGMNANFPNDQAERVPQPTFQPTLNQGSLNLPALPAAYLEQLPPEKYDFPQHKTEPPPKHKEDFTPEEPLPQHQQPAPRQRVRITPRPIKLQRKPSVIERNYPETESHERINENATVPYKLVVEASGEETKLKEAEKETPPSGNVQGTKIQNSGKGLNLDKYQRPTWGRNDKKWPDFKQRLQFNTGSQFKNYTGLISKAKLDTFYNDDLAKSAPDTGSSYDEDDDDYDSGEEGENENQQGSGPFNAKFHLPFLNKKSDHQTSQKNHLQSIGPKGNTPLSFKGFEWPKKPFVSRKGKNGSRKKETVDYGEPIAEEAGLSIKEPNSGNDKSGLMFEPPPQPHVEGMDTEHAKMLLKQLEQEWNEGMKRILSEVTGPHKPQKFEPKSPSQEVSPPIANKSAEKVEPSIQQPFTVITSEEEKLPQSSAENRKITEVSSPVKHHKDEKRSCPCSENEINSYEDKTGALPTFIVGQPNDNVEIQGLDDLKRRIDAARRGRLGHKVDNLEEPITKVTDEKHTICGCGRHHESSREVAASKNSHSCSCGCQDDVVRSVNSKPELNKYDIMHNMLLWMKHYVPNEPLAHLIA